MTATNARSNAGNATSSPINDNAALIRALENEEIIQLYTDLKARQAFCPMTFSERVKTLLGQHQCDCVLCTTKRVTVASENLKKKIMRTVVVEKKKILQVGTVTRDYVKQVVGLNGMRNVSVDEFMEDLARAQRMMAEALVKAPMMTFDEFFIEEDCTTKQELWLARFARRNYVLLRPLCYQLSMNASFKNQLLLGTNFFTRENLVGIEHNPGPDMLIQYLKNSEKIPDFATTRKRSSSVAKSLISLERRQQKSKDKELNELRRMKNARIFPQGLFGGEVSLSRETAETLDRLANSLVTGLTNIHVTHQVNTSLEDKFSLVLKEVLKYGSKIWEVIKGFILIACQFLEPSIASLVRLFVGIEAAEDEEDVFFDAPEAQFSMPWTALMSFLYAKTFAQYVYEKDWELFSHTLFEMKKNMATGNLATNVLASVLKEVGIFAHDVFGYKIPFIFDEDALLTELQEEAKILWAQYSTGKIDDYAFAEKVSIFMNEVENLLYEKGKRVTPEQKERLTYLLRKFQPVAAYCMRYVNPNNGPRVEPLAILIGGPTGVGKSTFTVPFLLALMSRILPEDKRDQFLRNHNDFMFFRANENEFWDGHKMRNVAIVYDDFGQMKDSVGAPSADAFEIIRLKNTAPYHLHFAAIEDKQRNFATPKLIFATTNLNKLYFNGLTCSEAVARRFDLSYIQVPKLAYCRDTNDDSLWSRRLDIEKVRQDYPENFDDPASFVALEVAEFIPWDFSTGTQKAGPALDFWGLLDYAEKEFIKVTSKGDRMLKFHSFIKENPRPQAEGNFFDFGYVKSEMSEIIRSFSEGRVKYSKKVAATTITGGAALFACIGLVYKLLSSQAAPESSNSKGDVKGKKGSMKAKSRARDLKRNNRAIKHMAKGMVSPQNGDSKLNAYLKVLKRNMYKIGSADDKSDIGWVTFLYDRVFVMPRHFLLALDAQAFDAQEEGKTLQVCFKNPHTKQPNIVVDWVTDVEFYDFEDDTEASLVDYVFMTIKETKCRIHSDITQMFTTRSRFRDGEKVPCQMIVERGGELMFMLPDVRVENKQVPYASGTYTEEAQEILVHANGLVYTAPTEVGDCGSVLLTVDPRFSRPTILGFHTAGQRVGAQRVAYGTFIPCETIEQMKKQVGSFGLQEKMPVEDVRIESFSALHQAQQPRVPQESKIIPSEMCDDLWERTTEPAHLKKFTNSKGQTLDPSLKARVKYAHPEVFIDSDVLEISHSCVQRLVLSENRSRLWEPHVLDFETAVCGVDGVEFLDAINRSTSPGYPFVLDNRQKGKTKWFGTDGRIDLTSPGVQQVKQMVLECIEDAKNGIRNEHIFIDYLKDERRPKAKVDEGKTRQFMACGMVYLIAMKMYFGDFIRSVCENRITNGVAVGVNPYEEWGTLYRYLKNTPSKKMTAGDYSSFDARIPVPIGYRVLEIVEQFYYNSSAEDRRVREVLFLEVVNSMHLSHGIVYEFVGGNPSGQPMTSIFNSIANLEMIAYMGACNHCRNGGTLISFPEVFDRSRFSVFGDDNVISYEPVDKAVFGQQALEANSFELLGMEYTVESKDGAIHEDRDLEEVSFLKRGFRFDHGRCMCPLDIEVLKETLAWKKKDTTETEFDLRVESVLAELALHGKTVFDEHAPVVLRAYRKHFGKTPMNATYHVAINSTGGLAFIITAQGGGERHQYLDACRTGGLSHTPGMYVRLAEQKQNDTHEEIKQDVLAGHTTSFSEDAVAVINDGRAHLFAPTAALERDAASIAMFMAKPYIFNNATWSAVSTSNAILNSWSISDLIRANPFWMDKLQGYAYFRGTAVVRLELNAQPFQAGKLLLHFLPQYDARIAFSKAFAAKNQTLCSKTQQYSVHIDARDSVATMRIPYISPFSHWKRVSPDDAETDWGRLFLTVLSPLVTGTGTNKADYSLTLHFEDVDVATPVAQSSGVKPRVLKRERKNMAEKGTISSTLENLIEPVSYFKNVPFVGEWVGVAQDVLKGASGLFSAFGWSKPIYEAVAAPVARSYLRFVHNFGGTNLSHVMALDATNHLEPLTNVGGSTDDEMSFAYLKKIPALVHTFSWSTSSPQDTILFEEPITQMTVTRTNTIATHSYTLKYGPPYSFISRYFRYYRGSIDMHIKFAKTQFHTGKIMVLFEPSDGVANLASSQNALRSIIDLKDCSELTLNLPYLLNRSYISVGESIGRVSIRVLNPLVAPDTVSSSIEALVYYSAGDDYEVAFPVSSEGGVAVAQMNVPEKMITSERIGGYDTAPLTMIPVSTCIGEAFVSLKQLLTSSRPLIRTTTFSSISNAPATGYNSMLFWPWLFGVPQAPTLPGSPIFELPPYYGDYVSELATGFAYYRGGLRFTFPRTVGASQDSVTTLVDNDTRVFSKVISTIYPNDDQFMGRIGTTSLVAAPGRLRLKAYNGDVPVNGDFTIPYYGPTPFRLTNCVSGIDPSIPDTLDTNPDMVGVTYNSGNDSNFTGSALLRSGADDFQLMYFCGFSGWSF